ncbi:hypothetical protein GCM10017056_48600 [Seohaeicola zhoushanensis]|uniref:Uncharacterized protein n=1 Tax=Seohaeicola zhoushanensis TaxID=1569283 RepID=A0A8J3MC82_9RHOB|nr:hypothetical protein GCM10017056_48600 [Seohaeicola zhoushanensis]
MCRRDDTNSDIPAAYTYLGQFLAHDMSYLQGGTESEGVAWVNANALHALEFKSLFGTASMDEGSSSEWISVAGSSLGIATQPLAGQNQTYDLPRSIEGGFPCCPDPRADSKLGLAQMHVLLVRFHQMMALNQQLNTEEAQYETKRHLQAMVLTDYLRRIIPEEIYVDVMRNGRKFVAPSGPKEFLVSIEFATAIFRFGHSMILWKYGWWGIKWPELSSLPPVKALLRDLLDFIQHVENAVKGLLQIRGFSGIPVQFRHPAETLRWYLWHGKVLTATTSLQWLIVDCARLHTDDPVAAEAARRVQARCRDLYSYLANKTDNLTDYGRRYRRGLPISSSRAEGCVDDIGNTRMGKRRRMRWSPKGAHRVAVVRAAVLDGRLTGVYQRAAA